MKNKLFIISVIVLISITVFGQSQRLVLFEEFTQASCGPCASQNPAFNALLSANPTKCTSIKYQTSWPGYDPMNLHNPADVANRVSYYSVGGVPDVVMDGNAYHGQPNGVNQAKINTQYAVPSPFELYVNQELSTGNDSIYVTILGKATGAVSGSFVVHCVVIEKHIHFNSAPGSNGEKDFYNVMKKMLPGPSGTPISSSFQPGDYFVYKYAWKLANVYSINELSVVSFIQNTQTKNVLQAANTTATPISGVYQNDLTLQNTGNLLSSYCEPSIEPTFEIQNNGNLPLTSAEIKYRINDEAVKTYSWTGNLGFLKKATIALPATAFTVQPSNVLKIYGVKTNGVDDEYKKNDTVSYNFLAAKVTPTQLKLYIKTDNNPEETTWDIKDLLGNVIESGGPYTKANFGYSITLNLPAFNCYEFTIHDAGGNGLANGTGSFFSLYFPTASGNNVILTGTNFGSSSVCQFSTFSGVGIDQAAEETFTIFPNPVSGIATVTISDKTNSLSNLQVFDMQGKMVVNQPVLQYSAGMHKKDVDCSNLAPGMYTFRVTNGDRVYNKKVAVTR